jgi:hypothetical protein
MLKRDRPWHKSKRGPPPKLTKPDHNDVPFVTINGTKFYSDRFYLNATLRDDTDNDDFLNETQSDICHCGAKNPPPLFSRSALVDSCHSDLKAVIFGTYTFDLATLQQEFPTLFGACAKTPCLVLHGKKGWSNAARTSQVENDDDDPESVPKEDEYVDHKDDCSISLETQDEETIESSKLFDRHSTLETPQSPIPQRNAAALPETVHFAGMRVYTGIFRVCACSHTLSLTFFDSTEVTSTWLRPQDIPQSFGAAVDNDTGFLRHDAVVSKRLFKRGVHHPKFMILIQESGSIVVVVSTANLTPAVTIDASWVQRFPPAAPSPTTQSAQYRATDNNDFGPVLANFLQCQMLSTAAEQITTHWFVKKYLGWNSVVDLERLYDFSNAQAKLVPTVPGDYQVNDATNVANTTTTTRKLLYGQERVADCLKYLSLPPSLLTDQDRLIFQPTSFGSDWNRRNMAYLVRSYLGEQQNSEMRDRTLLERLDIVWPNDHFVREASRNPAGRSTPLAISERNNGCDINGRSTNLDMASEADRMDQACLFLSSETFNNIDLTCLNRMVMFEPSNPLQQPATLCPHFKSVARLFHGSDYRIRKDYGVSKCEEYFSWFLMTSACLSRGAQGEALVETCASSEGTTVAYSNFELGILLCSHLAGSRGSSRSKKNRIYCWNPRQCFCASTSTTPRLIHLPIPYSVRPARYVEDEDEAILCETPYFHEIPHGTGCVGNMLLTPYGTALAAKYEKQAQLL